MKKKKVNIVSPLCFCCEEHRMYHAIGQECPCRIILWAKIGETLEIATLKDKYIVFSSETPVKILRIERN